MNETNQIRIILDYLKAHGSITTQKAFEMGVTRLSSIIYRLRKRGYTISTELVRGTDRYGSDCTYGVFRLAEGE
jgi:hypothetical protein